MIFGGVEHLPCTPQANRVHPNMAQENGWCQAVAPEVRPSGLGHLCRVCCLELTCPRESRCVRKPTFQAGTQGARPIPLAVLHLGNHWQLWDISQEPPALPYSGSVGSFVIYLQTFLGSLLSPYLCRFCWVPRKCSFFWLLCSL